MQRHADIRASLDAMREEGFVRSWYAYAPGDSRGQRWVVDYLGGERAFTTRETEVFISGAKAVLFDRRIVKVLS